MKSLTKLLMSYGGYVEYIKAWQLRVPKQLKDAVIALFQIQVHVGVPVRKKWGSYYLDFSFCLTLFEAI